MGFPNKFLKRKNASPFDLLQSVVRKLFSAFIVVLEYSYNLQMLLKAKKSHKFQFLRKLITLSVYRLDNQYFKSLINSWCCFKNSLIFQKKELFVNIFNFVANKDTARGHASLGYSDVTRC